MPLNTSPPTCFYTHPPTRPWRRIHESIESMSWGIVCIVHAWLLASGTRSSAFTTLIKGTGIAFTVIGGLLMLLSLLWLVMRVTGMIGYREVKALGDGIVGVGVECDKGLTRAVRLAFGYVFMGSGALVGAIDNYAAASMATVLLLCGIACLFSCKDEDRPVIVLDCDRGSHPKQFISAKTGEIESSAKLRKPVKYAVVPSSYFVVQEEFTCPCKVAKQQQCRFTGKYTQAELVCIACYEAQRMNITHVWMADLCVGTVIDGSHECCGLSNKDQARLIDGRPARIFQNARAVIFPVLACPCAAHNILFPKPWKQRIFDALRGKLKVSLHATHSTPSGNVTTTCVHHLTTSLDTRLSHPSALQELLYARKISIVAAGRHHTSANPDIPNDPSTISTRTTHFQTWFTNVSKTLVSWRKASALSLYLELDRRYTHLQSPKSFDSTVLETQEYTILKHLRDIFTLKAGWICLPPTSLSARTILAKAFTCTGDPSLLTLLHDPTISIPPTPFSHPVTITSSVSAHLHQPTSMIPILTTGPLHPDPTPDLELADKQLWYPGIGRGTIHTWWTTPAATQCKWLLSTARLEEECRTADEKMKGYIAYRVTNDKVVGMGFFECEKRVGFTRTLVLLVDVDC